MTNKTIEEIVRANELRKFLLENVIVDEHGFIYIKQAELIKEMDKELTSLLKKVMEGTKEKIATLNNPYDLATNPNEWKGFDLAQDTFLLALQDNGKI